MDNNIITTIGGETVISLCERYGVTRDSLISINSGGGSVYIGGVRYNNLSEYLIQSASFNSELVNGVSIKIPINLSGGIEKEDSYEYQYETSNKSSKVVTDSSRTQGSLKKFECYFSKYAGGSLISTFALPVYPQEFSDSNSAEFNSQSMFGRSVAYQVYNTSSRSLSFTLQLHEELVDDDYDYIHQLVSEIESACYPEYGVNLVRPPEVMFTIGKHFKIRGILSSCSSTWSPPIIDGKMVNCSLSISVIETTGPYSMSDVAKFKGYREGSGLSYSGSSSRTTVVPSSIKPSASYSNYANESYSRTSYTNNRMVPMTK